MYKSIAEAIPCKIYVPRLREYITVADLCNYLEISSLDRSVLAKTRPSDEYLPEEERDKAYHLKKIKYFMENGIDKPIDIDCFCRNGQIFPWPIILDGRHRYAAALLRNDKIIPCTFSGRYDLYEYLSLKRNNKPLVCTTIGTRMMNGGSL